MSRPDSVIPSKPHLVRLEKPVWWAGWKPLRGMMLMLQKNQTSRSRRCGRYVMILMVNITPGWLLTNERAKRWRAKQCRKKRLQVRNIPPEAYVCFNEKYNTVSWDEQASFSLLSLPDFIIQMKANELAGVSTVSHTRYVSATQSDQQQLEKIFCTFTLCVYTQRYFHTALLCF